MATVNPEKTEWNRAGGPIRANLAGQAETWHVPTLDGISPVTDYVAGAQRAFIYDKKVWLRDDTDVTSPHDAISVIVTNDSVRFKSTAVYAGGVYIWPVIDVQSAPPATAAAGDAYLVDVAPSGAWATHGKAIATCTVGGQVSPPTQVWVYTPAQQGMVAFDKSRNVFMTYDTSNLWIDGLPGVYGNLTIPPEALEKPNFTVQSQTSTTPVSPSSGQYWIVGTGATGAFSGHDGTVARYDGPSPDVFTFFTPAEGWLAWNVATQRNMVYTSGAWRDVIRNVVVAVPAKIVRTSVAAASGAAPASFAAAAPTNASGTLVFPDGSSSVPVYTLQKSGNRLKIQLRLDLQYSAGADLAIAVFKDGQVTADSGNWILVANQGSEFTMTFEFEIAIGDTSSHQYNIRAYGGEGIARSELQFVEIEP